MVIKGRMVAFLIPANPHTKTPTLIGYESPSPASGMACGFTETAFLRIAR